MDTFLIIIIIALVLAVILLLAKNKAVQEAVMGGFARYNRGRQEEKEKAKARIMEIIHRQGKATNQEVRQALKIADPTATRYLQELEKEGKVAQKGEGGGAYYTKI